MDFDISERVYERHRGKGAASRCFRQIATNRSKKSKGFIFFSQVCSKLRFFLKKA
jgi:hypothetical protein